MESERMATFMYGNTIVATYHCMNAFIGVGGGATPAHGMSAKRVELAALGRLVLRACVRPSVRTSHAEKGPKGLQYHWKNIT